MEYPSSLNQRYHHPHRHLLIWLELSQMGTSKQFIESYQMYKFKHLKNTNIPMFSVVEPYWLKIIAVCPTWLDLFNCFKGLRPLRTDSAFWGELFFSLKKENKILYFHQDSWKGIQNISVQSFTYPREKLLVVISPESTFFFWVKKFSTIYCELGTVKWQN